MPLALPAEFSEWRLPLHAGAAVNSEFNDSGPMLTKNGLSLYFQSNRPGIGSVDLWVAHRSHEDDPWQASVILPEPIKLSITTLESGKDEVPILSFGKSTYRSVVRLRLRFPFWDEK
jgi:hypothetical protein